MPSSSQSHPFADSSAGAARGWRYAQAAALVAWLGFCAWCASGAAPAVDLPAHAAELEVLKGLLRGEPAASAVYDWHFTLGYGLTTWLFLPLAFLANGAFAARVAMFAALALFPVSLAALLRALGRPTWPVLLALPFAFNVSYWYGLLPGLFAQPLAVFAVAAAVRALDGGARRWWLAVNLLAAAVLMSNLFTFVALGVAMTALVLQRRGLRGAPRALAGALLGPALLAVPMLVPLLSRSTHAGPWPQTQYDLAAHYNWFFKTLGPEGALSLAAPLIAAAAFVGLALWRGARERERAGLWVTLALAGLYLATPKTLGGIFLVCTRLPSLTGLFALAAVDGAQVPRWARAGLVALSVGALAQVGLFHARFAETTFGLDAITAAPPPPRHGYLSLDGARALGSKHIYLAHLGQWWTARHGGVGHDFFADSDHHAVRFLPGVTVPAELSPGQPADFARFDALLVFGRASLPSGLEAFDTVEQVGPWRRLVRRGAEGQVATRRAQTPR